MEGIERLQTEVLEMNNYNVSAIFDYIKTRPDMLECFKNEEKSIKQMYEFICNKAKNLRQGNVAMVNDNVVYLWAITYFKKSNEELGLNKKEEKAKVQVDNTPIPKEEPKPNETDQISMFQEVNN